MLDAARRIQQYSAGLTEKNFRESTWQQDAILHALQIIGEAARQIRVETRQAYAEINWSKIIGMRSFIIHEFFRIDLTIVWDTIEEDIDPLIANLEAILGEQE
jgi:uncharacterized protein with HEPN domain